MSGRSAGAVPGRQQALAIVALLLCLLAAPLRAEEVAEQGFLDTGLGQLMLAEAVFVANAGLATLDPQVYGVLGALLFPLAAASESNEAARWTGLIAGEALAAYNIVELDKDENSDSEIFLRNIVAWHAFAAVVGLASWLGGDGAAGDGAAGEGDRLALNAQLTPLPQGAWLQLSYAF